MYTAVNNALNDVLLDGRYQGRPLYLVLDNAARRELSSRLGVEEEVVEAHACKLVGRSLTSSGNPYTGHERTLNGWLAARRPGRPPHTALLYTLSHAAELMVSDGKFSSNNYYHRLAAVTNADRDRLASHGNATARFWREFARWLVASNYNYGRPTARAGVHAYVSLAISQAVVREADRHCFHHMFEKYGFSGTDVISENEIYQYISAWIYGPHATARLQSAWHKEELRPRICEAAVAELAEWTTSLARDGSGGSGASRLSLAASLVPRFPSRWLSLVMGRQETIYPPLELAQVGNDKRLSRLGNATYGNFATLAPPSTIDIAATLTRGATFSRRDGEGTFSWRPRFIIPLSRSESGPYWAEVTRVTHALEHLVLVRSDRRHPVEQLLSASARPVYTLATPDRLPGLPPGWLLYENVQILHSRDQVHEDLLALSPVSDTGDLKLSGGMKLARGIWHRSAPPMVGIDTQDRGVKISARDGVDDTGEIFAEAKTDSNQACLRLDPKAMPKSGLVFVDARLGDRVLGTTGFLCRSARTPRPLDRQGRGQLGYRSVLTAQEHASWQEAEPIVQGYVAQFEPISPDKHPSMADFHDLSGGGEREEPSEQELEAQDVVATIANRSADDQAGAGNEKGDVSCGERGYHHWMIPPFSASLPRDAMVNAECKDCKLTALMRRRGPKGSPPLKPKKLSPVPASANAAPESSRRVNYELLLDALCFLGSGSWAALETVASGQLDEFWTLHSIARDLALLGHIDVELEEGSGRLRRWSVPPPAIAYIGPSWAVLCGFRSGRVLSEVSRMVIEAGGSFERTRLPSQPSVVTIGGLVPNQARDLFSTLKDPHRRLVKVVDAAAQRLTSACDTLGGLFSLVVPASPGSPASLQRYDLQAGRWRAAADFSEEGAYRYEGAGVEYVYRDQDGRTVRGPHELIKLIDARHHNVRLHSYDEETRAFSSRLGCEPVGLLGRALVASSGRLPVVNKGTSIFCDVAPEVAGHVLRILYSGELPS